MSHVAGLVFAMLLAATACGAQDEAVTTSSRIDSPFAAADPLGRSVDIVGLETGFVAVQVDGEAATASAAVFADGTWGEPVLLPVENVLSVAVASDSEGVYIVAATAADRTEDAVVLGSGGLTVAMLAYGGDEWSVVGSIGGEESPALRASTQFTVSAAGAHDGQAIVSIHSWDSDEVEIWRLGIDGAATDPPPPAGVVDFCADGGGNVYGLTSTAIVAGSMVPGDEESERVVEGDDAFFDSNEGSWTSVPYEPPDGALFDQAALVCDDDGPLAIWPTEVVDGRTGERRDLSETEGTFLTRGLAGPRTALLRSSQQGVERVDELGEIGTESVNFVRLDTPLVVAAALDGVGDALVATVDVESGPEVVWYLVGSPLPD